MTAVEKQPPNLLPVYDYNLVLENQKVQRKLINQKWIILILSLLTISTSLLTFCYIRDHSQQIIGIPLFFEEEEVSLTDVALNRHNLYRYKHAVPNLTAQTSLSTSAQNYANKCIWAHSGTQGVGENLYASTVQTNLVNAGIDSWYSEIQYYDFNNPGFSYKTGHFTQVVWKSSLNLGCGAKKCPNLMGDGRTWFLLVCQYSPPGNYIGQFAENVLRPVR